jgi:uncharacterized repeat protein (TIGR01451 family)
MTSVANAARRTNSETVSSDHADSTHSYVAPNNNTNNNSSSSDNNNAQSNSNVLSDNTTDPVAGLEITKAVDNANPLPGQTVNYTLTVTTLGPATSSAVTATDVLPPGLALTSATSSIGTYSSSTGVWTIGDLSAGSTETLSVAAMVNASDTAGQSIVNAASIGEASNDTNPDAANASSSVAITVGNTGGGGTSTSTPSADLIVGKTVDNSSPMDGNTVNYTVTATDMGPATSTGITVSDMLPAGLVFDSATTSQGSYDATSGVWTVGDLAASSSATLVIGVTVSANSGTVITNTATGNESASSTDPNMTNNTATANLTVGTSSTITAPQTLSIGPNGSFLGHGMVITSVSSGSFGATIWGITYTVNFDSIGHGARPSIHDGDDGDSDDSNGKLSSTSTTDGLDSGDVVNVSGMVTSESPFVVNASMVTIDNGTGTHVSNSENENQGGTGGGDSTNTQPTMMTYESGNNTSTTYFESHLNDLTQEIQNLQTIFRGRFGG